MTSKRYQIIESWGYGHRGGIRYADVTEPRVLAASTVAGLVREVRRWASGHADTFSDATSDGWRVVIASHWVNGFENIRRISMREV